MSVLSEAVYAKDRYDFVELSKDHREYQEQYKEMRVSLIIQHAPELLGEYATYPVLQSRDEKGIREFQRQIEVRKKRALEIPEEEFPIEFYVLKKVDGESKMHLYLEGRFGCIGGSFSGPRKRATAKFGRLYKDIHRYYGVSQDDIVNKTERYKVLLMTLAIKH